MISSVQTIKKITTIMDIVGVILALISIIIGIVLFTTASGLLGQSTNYLNTHEFSELIGGYEVLGGQLALGGSLFGVMIGLVLIGLAVIMLIAFLIPAIHGIVLWKKTNTYLLLGDNAYKEAAKRDSILKLIFGGIPCLLFLYDFIGSWNGLEAGFILYFIVICGLEITAFIKMNNR